MKNRGGSHAVIEREMTLGRAVYRAFTGRRHRSGVRFDVETGVEHLLRSGRKHGDDLESRHEVLPGGWIANSA
jgi:hypothetical protein